MIVEAVVFAATVLFFIVVAFAGVALIGFIGVLTMLSFSIKQFVPPVMANLNKSRKEFS